MRLQNSIVTAFLTATLCLTAGAGDSDTIPLKYKTEPSQHAEPSESTLLNQQKKTNYGTDVAPKATGAKIPTIQVAPVKPADAGGPPGPGGGPTAKPYLASVETFGSEKINDVIVKEFLGKDFTTWVDKGLKSDATALELEPKLIDRVKKKWGFAEADFSVVQYFEPGNLAIHITLDVVEPQDMGRRAPFTAVPKGEFKDPDNLIRTWLEYEDLGLQLVETGDVDPDTVECSVALHCPFGHKHPKLKKYEKIFSDGMKKNEAAIMQIGENDKRQDFRAAATYLMAYLKDGKKVVNFLIPRTKDPTDLVRNNALRVLGDIAEKHQEFIIPVRPILDALVYPRVSDRSKAIYVLFHMANNSQAVREEILKTSIPDIFKILASTQPDHHEIAHSVLRRVSGKDFAVNDLRSWNSWYAKLPSNSKGISKK